MRPINVLSLFDGMSCGRIALERAGIDVERYFASEIDKFAIKVSQNNYPDIEYIGDVQKVEYDESNGFLLCGEPGGEYDKDIFTSIDILIGGSPCQGFSKAGKGENFSDPRSKLFFEFVRILKETKPKYFILENVRMNYEHERTITQYLDWVEPMMINSSLVSAQNRERLYWVGELQENGKYMTVDIPQPEDKNIFLKDILEDEVDEKYYMSDKALRGFFEKQGDFGDRFKISSGNDKGACLTAKNQGSAITQTYILGNTHPSGIGQNGNVYDSNFKSPTLTSNLWQYNNPLFIPENTEKGYTEVKDGECFDYTQPNSKTRRGRNMKDKSNCMTAGNFDFMKYEKGRIRKLTPIECERLQTVPDNYTDCVSNSQRYKMLGNGWTVDVIAHILKHLDF